MFQKLEEELKLRGYSSKTIRAYTYHNRKFLDYIKKSSREIGTGDIRKYLGYLVGKGIKPRTLNLTYSALKFYYSQLMNRQLFRRINKSKVEKNLPRILSKKEINGMIDSTTNLKHKLLIELLYSSGTRITETVKLKVEDIDFDQELIFIKEGKGKKDRYIITSQRFLDDLKHYLKIRKSSSSYIFDKSNKHITVRTAERIIKNSAVKAGIDKRVYPHLLRASFATYLIEDKVGIEQIKKLMGHARINTTLGYLRNRTDDIKEIKSPLD
jgi:site-specific recombinase XerD|tara:strand:- start:8530 stop:9336 length:807 start_codon:yes stop_codon:yes gene_type:complete